MGDRRAEESHDGVADDLVDLTAEGRDVSDQALEAAVEEVLDVLRVRSLGEGREPDEVCEQHGSDAAFVGPGDQRMPASRAEPGLVGRVRAT